MYVYAYKRPVWGSFPMHTIYSFSLCIVKIDTILVKITKINKNSGECPIFKKIQLQAQTNFGQMRQTGITADLT